MPKITVLTITARDSYLKEQAQALNEQTLKDIEWVIVDDIYGQRKDFAKQVKCDFPIIHIPPNEIVSYSAVGAAFNDGLVRASGEIVYPMADYMIPTKDCLARHYEIQKRFGGAMLGGRVLKVNFPIAELRVREGKIKGHDYRMWLFQKGYFEWKQIDDDLYEVPRAGVQNWWAGRNESVPLEALLECNGLEEGMDGRWGGHDAELANRFMTYGLKFIIDKKSIAWEFEHKSGANAAIKKYVRSEAKQQEFQHTLINKRVKDKVHRANEEWLVMLPRDLREERKCLKSQS